MAILGHKPNFSNSTTLYWTLRLSSQSAPHLDNTFSLLSKDFPTPSRPQRISFFLTSYGGYLFFFFFSFSNLGGTLYGMRVLVL